MISIAERNIKVEENLALVYLVVHKRLRRVSFPDIETRQDVFQELTNIGVIGLIKSVSRFNPKLCPNFSSFALPYINGEIARHFRDKGSMIRLPQKSSKFASQYENVKKQIDDPSFDDLPECERLKLIRTSKRLLDAIAKSQATKSICSIDVVETASNETERIVGELPPLDLEELAHNERIIKAKYILMLWWRNLVLSGRPASKKDIKKELLNVNKV